jgi:hypothetical protein
MTTYTGYTSLFVATTDLFLQVSVGGGALGTGNSFFLVKIWNKVRRFYPCFQLYRLSLKLITHPYLLPTALPHTLHGKLIN